MCSKHHLLSIGHHRKHVFFIMYKNILWCNAFNAPLTSCRFYERILLWKRKENCIKMKVIGNFISLLLAFNLLIVIKAFEKIDGQALNDIFYFHFGKNNNGILFPKLFWGKKFGRNPKSDRDLNILKCLEMSQSASKCLKVSRNVSKCPNKKGS